MPPHISVLILAVYSLLLIAGGLIGFYKANSRASLIAGSASGGIALLAAAWTWQGGPGIVLGLVLAFAMCVVFGIRLRKTKKFMPSGLLLVTSLVVLGLLGFAQFSGG